MDVDEATEADSSNITEASDNAARWVRDKDTAAITQQVVDKFLEASGWPGGRLRQSYGAGNGCTWNSPITEIFSREANIWTLQSFPVQILDVFGRSPTPAHLGDRLEEASTPSLQVYVVMEAASASMLESHSRGKFTPIFPHDLGMQVGTWIHPVIEMTNDGTPHPLRFPRLPLIGPWEDWELACSWALKTEWQDADGRWLSRYLCAEDLLFSDLTPHPENGAMSLARSKSMLKALLSLAISDSKHSSRMYDHNGCMTTESLESRSCMSTFSSRLCDFGSLLSATQDT